MSNLKNAPIKRLMVTGILGQVASALHERTRTSTTFRVIQLGRPEFDLLEPGLMVERLKEVSPDVIVSAAAYTAVDQAETDEKTAFAINGLAPHYLAEAAEALKIPIIHLSTDYVFDGAKSTPYLESDPPCPIGAYGRTKLSGEFSVMNSTDNYAILRTAWVYSPFGKNFLKTMLQLGRGRDFVRVVSDQIGNPTSALDIADGVLQVAGNLLEDPSPNLRGTFHMAAAGEATWAEFATRIFIEAEKCGERSPHVHNISTSEYPTPARRPSNSRLDSRLIGSCHGVLLPHWHQSVAQVVASVIDSYKQD